MPTLQVREPTPGTWLVGGTAVEEGSAAVYLYANDIWRCGGCDKSFPRSFNACKHVRAVILFADVTECFEPGCSGIACGVYKVDGVDTPLCPEHYSALVKSVPEESQP